MSATCIGKDNKKYELISYNPNIYRCDSFYTFDCPKEGRIWNSIPSCLTKVDLPKQHLKTFKIETFMK